MSKHYLFDAFIGKLHEMRFQDELTYGLSFILGWRLALVTKEELESKNISDANTYQEELFDKYFDVNLGSKLNSRYEQDLINAGVSRIVDTFREFAYLTSIHISSDRLNLNGEKTTLLNPIKNKYLFPNKKPEDMKTLHDFHMVYELFFLSIGETLKQIVDDHNAAFAFTHFFNELIGHEDQVGNAQFFRQFEEFLPPLYMFLLTPDCFLQFYDETGKTKSLPFHFALRPLLYECPHELGESIWSEQRVIFYNQETLEPQNEEFQYIHIEESAKTIFDSYIEARYKHQNIIDYFQEKVPLFGDWHQQLKDYKMKKNDDLYSHIYKIIKRRWGFERNQKLTISGNVTFLAMFYLTFIITYIANPDHFKKLQ